MKQEIQSPEHIQVTRAVARDLSAAGQVRIGKDVWIEKHVRQFWNPPGHLTETHAPERKRSDTLKVVQKSETYRRGHALLITGVSRLLGEQKDAVGTRAQNIDRWLEVTMQLNVNQRGMVIGWLGKGRILTVEEALEKISRRIQKDNAQGKHKST